MIKFIEVIHIFEIHFLSLFLSRSIDRISSNAIRAYPSRHLHARISMQRFSTWHRSQMFIKSVVLRRGGWQQEEEGGRDRWVERKEGRGRAWVPGSDRGRRRRNELKAHTVAATRGSDLWWDYRWRYFFITVSPGCISLSLSFFSLLPLIPDTILLAPSAIFSLLDWLAWPPQVSTREAPSASSRHCLYLPTSVTYTPPRTPFSSRGVVS